LRAPSDEEDPEAGHDGEGGALEANRALLAGQDKTLQETATPREADRVRVTVLDHRGEGQNLWRGNEAEPQRAVTRKGDGQPT